MVALLGLTLLATGVAHAEPVEAEQVHAAQAQAPQIPPVAQCQPRLQGAWMAPEVHEGQRPTQGWVPVQLPHQVSHQEKHMFQNVWYHLRWQLHCAEGGSSSLAAGAAPHLALGISGIRSAGAVYWNNALLWRDRSLVEPLSRSWNIPRWWPVAVQDVHAPQEAWVRVLSAPSLRAGLGDVVLGDAKEVEAEYAYRYWRQRTSYMVMAGLATAIASVALVVWLWRRSERIYLWMGCMQASWALYLSVILSTESWWGMGSDGMASLGLMGYLLFTQCFMVFTLRFGEQRFYRLETVTWGVLALWVTVVLLHDHRLVPDAGAMTLLWGWLVANGSCWYMLYRAWRTRKPQHGLLALCWLVMGVVGVHDIVVALQLWNNHLTWMAFTGPLIMLVLAALLGWQVAHHMRRVDHFNQELQVRVQEARDELALALAREHDQALQHAKLHERMQLAHDLHDGLGGSLVRSMALVEQAPQPLSNERVLSLLKVLRDDLRQVIDSGSSGGMAVPPSPVQWLAPLRHRFMRILDEVGMQAQWHVAPHWHTPPSALQCMALVRFLEEAFTNVLKHSRARQMTLRCDWHEADGLVLSLHDDGVGFDVQAVQQSGMSVGMRSMHGRLAKVGATLQVQSSHAGGTTLTARVPLGALRQVGPVQTAPAAGMVETD